MHVLLSILINDHPPFHPYQRAEACLPGVREMNPLATVECHTSPPSSLPDSFFSSFDIIVASDLPPSQLVRLDALMRERGREGGRGGGFMYADTFGLHGWAFVDLGEGFKGWMDEASKGGGGGGRGGGEKEGKVGVERGREGGREGVREGGKEGGSSFIKCLMILTLSILPSRPSLSSSLPPARRTQGVHPLLSLPPRSPLYALVRFERPLPRATCFCDGSTYVVREGGRKGRRGV